MNVWEIIEAIDDPSGLIHPEKHQAFAQQTHPLGKHPSYPRPEAGGKAVNYEEVLANRQWQKILQKSNQYLGIPLTQQALPVLQKKLISALGLISQAEESHKEELEALAVHLVFELPEFKSARKAYEEGQLEIDAQLSDEIDSTGMSTSDEAESGADEVERPQRTPADEEWMKKMVQRRHFTNAMIQGAAVSNNFLFELGGAALDRISPGLRKAYGVLMVSTELGYWIFPQSAVIQGAKQQLNVGAVRIEAPEGIPIVKASGTCLPVLIQEIIKGLAEVASLASLPKDAKEREEVIKQADMVDLEAWSMILGPKLWEDFLSAVDAENERDLAMHLYRHIQNMDVDKFNGFMKELLEKTPRGMQMLRQLAAKIKNELAQDEDAGGPVAEAKSIIDHLLDDEEEIHGKDMGNPSNGCPECQSFNTFGPDEEGLIDCLNCGIWFKPDDPGIKDF